MRYNRNCIVNIMFSLDNNSSGAKKFKCISPDLFFELNKT